MGIHGLWPIVESTAEKVSLETLEGKRVAVDVSIWLYQAQLGFAPDAPSPHVQLLIRRLAKLVYYHVKPIFVFDGPRVPHFKRRVLDERALRRHADDIAVTAEKRRHLETLAKSDQQPEDVQRALTKLRTSPQKRRKQAAEEQLYALPESQRPLEDSEASEEEDVIEVPVDHREWRLHEDDGDKVEELIRRRAAEEEEEEEDEEARGTVDLHMMEELDEGLLNDVQALAAKREQMRQARLKPEQVPEDSVDFSNFQLQRLLGRQRVNERIDELKKARIGRNVLVSAREGRKREHLIQWDEDEDCRVVTEAKKPRSPLIGRLALSLDHFEVAARAQAALAAEEEGGGGRSRREAEDIQRAIALSLAPTTTPASRREYVSKSGMLEGLARKRAEWERDERSPSEARGGPPSSSDDDDFEDVPMIGVLPDFADPDDDSPRPGPSTWSPALEEDGEMAGDLPLTSEAAARAAEEDCERGVQEYRELQEVLSTCGFPWIEAPGEAEAQCVWLEKEGLVDAVVSDDSDCFAFGARRLIRHMFARDKEIEYYDAVRTEKELGLSRWDTVSVAMLSGGDYYAGLKGVGVVAALELMGHFTNERRATADEEEDETLSRLQRISQWLLDKERKMGVDSMERRKLRTAVERGGNEEQAFRELPSSAILGAYARPLVDESREPFKWMPVQLDRLKRLLWTKLQWDEERIGKTVQDAFVRWNTFMSGQSSYQMHLTSFLRPISGTVVPRKELTKRVEAALAMIRERRDHVPKEDKPAADLPGSAGDLPGELALPSSAPRPLRGRPRARGRGRGRGRGSRVTAPRQLQLSESSSSSSSEEDEEG